MSIKRPTHNPLVKPAYRQCTVQDVASNCARLGLPVPVLALPMWEGAGTKVFDLSKEQNHGVLKNGAFWSGDVLDFDGANDGLEIPSSPSLEITDNLTISAWVYPHAIGSSGSKMVCKFYGGTSSGTNYILHAYSTYIAFRLSIAGVLKSVAGNAPILNQWCNIIGTYNGVDMRIYEDGKETGYMAQTGNIVSSVHPLLIGNSGQSSGGVGNDFNRNFNGLVKSVFVFDAGLTAEQVKTLYENPYGMYDPLRPLTWAIAGSGTPQDPYFIRGTITKDGVGQASETVTVRNDTKGEQDTCETNAQGHFIFMLNDLDTDYEDGDSIEVTAL